MMASFLNDAKAECHVHCYGARTFHTQRFEYFKSYKLSVKAKYSFHPAAGVCLSSPVDTFYVLGSDKELFGLTHTSLVFAPARGRWGSISSFHQLTLAVRWEVVFTDNGTLLAYTNITQLPLGLHSWHFEEAADCGYRCVLLRTHIGLLI